PAEYSLVEQVDGRGVFSFCMCPGGILVPSSSTGGSLVLNGMSNSQRNSKWANAGIVVSVNPEDVKEKDPLALLRFQEGIEKTAFDMSGSLKAPAQRMTDFVRTSKNRQATSGPLPKSSYFPGLHSCSLTDVLPELVADRLRKAFLLFDRKMKGYYTQEALLLAVESRTSSPVRIPRDPETLQHVELEGIYPCGEGSGYAGGIVSSALDGINVADKI
ncbi:MAG: FAD-binding protein, partial [Bacteroidales bacterium]|nr:FAD-binding protein [Bacteroidales bacterium]